MIKLTDSHTHILPTDVPNYQEILENLKQNNIKRIIINGYNILKGRVKPTLYFVNIQY